MKPASRLFLVLPVAAALLGSASPAHALVIAMQGWTPVGGNTQLWQDSGGVCLIREDKYSQVFPLIKSQAAAQTVANRLRTSLSRKKMLEVVTQPLERSNGWGVLANYAYVTGGVKYRITQVFVSSGGRLRTISGSQADSAGSPCTAEMVSYLLYEAE